MAAKTEKEQSYPNFVISRLLGGLLTTVFWLAFAVILSILLEWIGIAFGLWGADHAMVMLNKDIAYLALLPTTVYGVPASGITIAMLGSVDSLGGSSLLQLGQSLGAFLSTAITAAVNIVLLFVVRLSIIVCAAPAFLLTSIVALVDGLVERDIRRHCGAPESSWIYHIAKPWIFPAFMFSAAIYLTAPFSINPFFIFAPAMIFMAFVLYITASKFKQFA